MTGTIISKSNEENTSQHNISKPLLKQDDNNTYSHTSHLHSSYSVTEDQECRSSSSCELPHSNTTTSPAIASLARATLAISANSVASMSGQTTLREKSSPQHSFTDVSSHGNDFCLNESFYCSDNDKTCSKNDNSNADNYFSKHSSSGGGDRQNYFSSHSINGNEMLCSSSSSSNYYYTECCNVPKSKSMQMPCNTHNIYTLANAKLCSNKECSSDRKCTYITNSNCTFNNDISDKNNLFAINSDGQFSQCSCVCNINKEDNCF